MAVKFIGKFCVYLQHLLPGRKALPGVEMGSIESQDLMTDCLDAAVPRWGQKKPFMIAFQLLWRKWKPLRRGTEKVGSDQVWSRIRALACGGHAGSDPMSWGKLKFENGKEMPAFLLFLVEQGIVGVWQMPRDVKTCGLLVGNWAFRVLSTSPGISALLHFKEQWQLHLLWFLVGYRRSMQGTTFAYTGGRTVRLARLWVERDRWLLHSRLSLGLSTWLWLPQGAY